LSSLGTVIKKLLYKIENLGEDTFSNRKQSLHETMPGSVGEGGALNKHAKTTKLILLDSLLQEVEETLPHLVFQIKPGPRLGIKTAKCNCSREST
jgi:hypothetical protein